VARRHQPFASPTCISTWGKSSSQLLLCRAAPSLLNTYMAAEPQPESEPATPHQLVSGPSVAWLAEIDEATAGSDDVDIVYKEGVLSKSKKNKMNIKKEQRRYVMLVNAGAEGPLLQYYDSKADKQGEHRGTLPLSFANCRLHEDTRKAFTVTVDPKSFPEHKNQGKPLTFGCTSEAEAQEWVMALTYMTALGPGVSEGACHCGTVTFSTTGTPEWTATCHCSICRRTHSAPYAELCAFKAANLKITTPQGTTNRESTTKYNCGGTSKVDRYFCKKCGAKVHSKLNHSSMGDCYTVFLQQFTTPNHGVGGQIDRRLTMACHTYYGSGTAATYDQLPKFDTLPTKLGGDGKKLPNEAPESDLQGTGELAGCCHCGKVKFSCVGLPEWTAICHCSVCRRTHSAPYAELCAFKDEHIIVTAPIGQLIMYNCDGSSKADRYFCKHCGTQVYSKLNGMGCSALNRQGFTKIDRRLAMSCHIYYADGTINSYDELPKFETLPATLGGDDKKLPNDYHGVSVATIPEGIPE
jgi:hypothetical protein